MRDEATAEDWEDFWSSFEDDEDFWGGDTEEDDMAYYGDSLIRFFRVEGVTHPPAGGFGTGFTHVTLARDAAEARAKVASKIPPFATVTRVYAVN